MLIVCPSMNLQNLRAQKKNRIWLIGEQEWEEEVTVSCVNGLNPGLELQPSGPEQHLFLLKRSPELPGLRMSAFWPLPTPGCWDSLVSYKPWSSFSPGISFPVSKQATLPAEMSFLPNLHPEGWECGQPSGRAPGSSHVPAGKCAPSSEAQNSQSSTSSSSMFVTRPKIPL